MRLHYSDPTNVAPETLLQVKTLLDKAIEKKMFCFVINQRLIYLNSFVGKKHSVDDNCYNTSNSMNILKK